MDLSSLIDRRVEAGRATPLRMDKARGDLAQLEIELRELWHQLVGEEPVLAARVRVAANFLHNAAAALDPGTVL